MQEASIHYSSIPDASFLLRKRQRGFANAMSTNDSYIPPQNSLAKGAAPPAIDTLDMGISAGHGTRQMERHSLVKGTRPTLAVGIHIRAKLAPLSTSGRVA